MAYTFTYQLFNQFVTTGNLNEMFMKIYILSWL